MPFTVRKACAWARLESLAAGGLSERQAVRKVDIWLQFNGHRFRVLTKSRSVQWKLGDALTEAISLASGTSAIVAQFVAATEMN